MNDLSSFLDYLSSWITGTWTWDFPDGTLELSYPWVLLLLPLPLLIWRFLPAYRAQQEAVRIPFFSEFAASAGRTPSRAAVILRRNWLQWLVAPLVWALILVSAARPQWVEPPLEKIESGRDLLLAVDISGSMDTTDFRGPDGRRIQRLDAVKMVLDDFISRRQGDRLGLLVFGNAAHVQAPFTQDYQALRELLDMTRVGMAGPQTMLGDAIGLAIKLFENSKAEHRVLIMLTDGNDSGSRIPPAKAAEIAGEKGITIHTVAIGDPNTEGNEIVDMAELENIAKQTGGSFFLGSDRKQLEDIYHQLDAIEKIEYETLSYRPKRPLFHIPLGVGLMLILIFQLLIMVLDSVSRWRMRHD